MDEERGRVHAWPMCLRRMAVECIRAIVCRSPLIPRSFNFAVAAGCAQVGEYGVKTPYNTMVAQLTDWLYQINCGYDPPATETGRLMMQRDKADVVESIHQSVREQLLPVPAGAYVRLDGFRSYYSEAFDEEVCSQVEAVVGPVTDAHRRHFRAKMDELAYLVREAMPSDDAAVRRAPPDPVSLYQNLQNVAFDH